MTDRVEINRDFESDIFIVKSYVRWIDGSITMMEHIVHPPSREEAEKVAKLMTGVIDAFCTGMTAIGYKERVARDPTSEPILGFSAAPPSATRPRS